MSSSIRTIPSAQESHLICRPAARGRLLAGFTAERRITAGGDLRPAPKTAYLFNLLHYMTGRSYCQEPGANLAALI